VLSKNQTNLIDKSGLMIYPKNMNAFLQFPTEISQALLQDALHRDLVTARRDALLRILWGERYLSREHLIARVEMLLGKGCFGQKAWEDTFYRDMRFVKTALAKAGFQLKYSRNPKSRGYYLAGEPPLHPALKQSISGALNELDDQQMEIYQKISPAQKFFQAVSIIDFGKRASSEARK
jgi:hypothetical protein